MEFNIHFIINFQSGLHCDWDQLHPHHQWIHLHFCYCSVDCRLEMAHTVQINILILLIVHSPGLVEKSVRIVNRLRINNCSFVRITNREESKSSINAFVHCESLSSLLILLCKFHHFAIRMTNRSFITQYT